MSKLTIDDISDLRAYERERVEFRTHVIALKKRRRVSVGPVTTFVFENRDTIRFQIQEMARIEKLISDEAIQGELTAYNPLIPEPGSLSATLFLELTDDAALREWLPKLVGIERHIVLVLADGTEVRSAAEAQHATQLTREHVTSAVHYLTFALDQHRREALADGAVHLVVDHPAYGETCVLSDLTLGELLADVAG